MNVSRIRSIPFNASIPSIMELYFSSGKNMRGNSGNVVGDAALNTNNWGKSKGIHIVYNLATLNFYKFH